MTWFTSEMSRPSSPTRVATIMRNSPSRNRLTVSTCCFCFSPVWPAFPISLPDDTPIPSSASHIMSTESL